MTGLKPLPAIAFQAWKNEIQQARDVNWLLALVSRYLAAWEKEDLSRLGWELSSASLDGSTDLFSRAVVATRAEIHFRGDAKDYPFMREMALTLAAASNRLRYLQALRAGPL